MKKTTSLQQLRNSPVSFKKGAVFCLVIYALLALFFISGGKDYVYDRVVHPALFEIRNNHTSASSELDSRIKIYAVDQKTMNTVDQETIPLKDWTAVFKALAKSKPNAVFIDKAFLLTLTTNKSEIKEFKEALKALKNVTAGATLSGPLIAGLDELPDSKLLKIDSYWPPASEGHYYGPRPEYVESFSHIGAIGNADYGYIKPVVRRSDGKSLLYWSLAPGILNIENSKILIDGQEIPVDDEGKLLVNLSSPAQYWKKTYSLINALKNAREGKKIDGITSDSVVVILTGMHTGATAMKNTPAGTMPGGFVMTEVINSKLTGIWLKYTGFELFYLLLFCFLGWLSALYFNAKNFWFALIVSEISILSAGVATFCFYHRLLPFAFPAVGFFFTALAIFAEKSRISEAKARALQYSLEGMVEPQKLEQIMRNPEQFRFEPKSQVLTVMFIDIVGFSTMAESESPAAVFERLRKLLGHAADIVHKSGGVIDRSLGDGLLCFFGYQFESDSANNSNHAEDAINCAAAIQKESLNWDFKSLESGEAVFPLRIGINTGEVYAGDLGGGRKIDFTIIGHSVNFAQRLESACENYRVMCGPATKDLLPANSKLRKYLSRKMINIKHHAELIESYELEPFQEMPDEQQKLRTLSRKFESGVRSEVRWPVSPRTEIFVTGSFGKGIVTNFSMNGLEINCDTYIGKGATITFEFTTSDGAFENSLKGKGITQITAEVRWSWKDGDTHRLGLLIKNQGAESKEFIFDSIRNTSLKAAN